VPFRIKPDRGQRPENVIHPPSKQRCDVFQDNDSWFQFANNSHCLVEQPASLAIKTGPASGVADVLARKTAANAIDSPIVGIAWRKGFDVPVSSDVGPVFFKDSVGIFVYLHLPFAGHSSSFKA